jgi:chromosome segregation ATPase
MENAEIKGDVNQLKTDKTGLHRNITQLKSSVQNDIYQLKSGINNDISQLKTGLQSNVNQLTTKDLELKRDIVGIKQVIENLNDTLNNLLNKFSGLLYEFVTRIAFRTQENALPLDRSGVVNTVMIGKLRIVRFEIIIPTLFV